MKLFDTVQFRKPKQNTFNLSHDRKMTLNMGDLVPILCQEILPGDKFSVDTEYLLRMTPLQAPMYQRVKVYTHFFYVPYRILWTGWKDFITGGKTGTVIRAQPELIINDASRSEFLKGGLADYMGIPPVTNTTTPVTNVTRISALPFRAYQMIYNEFYRDSTLSTEITFNMDSDGPQANQTDHTTMRKRAWEKDYFTSCLPWPQRGGEVLIPMDADINYKPTTIVRTTGGGALVDAVSHLQVNRASAGSPTGDAQAVYGVGNNNVRFENLDSITNGSATVGDMRKAFRLQEWLEKNATAGGRYIEQLLAHWGVHSSDARLQRPEYLGGSSNPIAISEVLSSYQAEDGTGLPQGTMAGHGISAASRHGFNNKRFEEHGVIIGIMSVLPTTGYQQGIPKMFQRRDKLEYPWPEFAHIGEQQVTMSELYANYYGAQDSNMFTFGYQSRYAEMKYQSNTTHGEFRDTLAYWHQNRIFATPPNLNQQFIEADPTHRVFAVTTPTVHKLYLNLFHKIHAKRSLPYFSTPSI